MERFLYFLGYALLAAFGASVAYFISFKLALNGDFSCVELGCGILTTFVIWPLICVAFLIAFFMVRWFWRSRSL